MELLDKKEERKITKSKVECYIQKYSRYFCTDTPTIRYQRMTSRWGSCRPTINSMTFNTFLAYTPDECIEYVVVHELAHYKQLNHSKEFYAEIIPFIPNYKDIRKELRKYEVIINAYRGSRSNVRRRKRFSVRQLYPFR